MTTVEAEPSAGILEFRINEKTLERLLHHFKKDGDDSSILRMLEENPDMQLPLLLLEDTEHIADLIPRLIGTLIKMSDKLKKYEERLPVLNYKSSDLLSSDLQEEKHISNPFFAILDNNIQGERPGTMIALELLNANPEIGGIIIYTANPNSVQEIFNTLSNAQKQLLFQKVIVIEKSGNPVDLARLVCNLLETY